MSEEKKPKSWADVEAKATENLEEELGEQEKKMIEANVQHQMNVENMFVEYLKLMEDQNNTIIKLLNDIHGEMVKANSMIPEIAYPNSPQEIAAKKSEPKTEVKTEPKKDISKPDNVGKEDEIIAHYKKEFIGLKSKDGEITKEMAEKFSFAFEPDKIIFKTNAYLPTSLFAAIAGKVEKGLNGKYIPGKGSHFILPYP